MLLVDQLIHMPQEVTYAYVIHMPTAEVNKDMILHHNLKLSENYVILQSHLPQVQIMEWP